MYLCHEYMQNKLGTCALMSQAACRSSVISEFDQAPHSMSYVLLRQRSSRDALTILVLVVIKLLCVASPEDTLFHFCSVFDADVVTLFQCNRLVVATQMRATQLYTLVEQTINRLHVSSFLLRSAQVGAGLGC